MRKPHVDHVHGAGDRKQDDEVDRHRDEETSIGRKLSPASVCDCFMYSGTAITAAIAVSLMVIDRIEPNAGSMRTSACGRTTWRIACARDIPSANAARLCPGRTDPTPARTISAT